jgi:hypothetical protein
MKPIRTMTQAELAAYVQSHLQKRGITVILSGGHGHTRAAHSLILSGGFLWRDISEQ